jgi:hypothetical protein
VIHVIVTCTASHADGAKIGVNTGIPMARALAKPVKGTVKFPDEMLLSLLSETKWLYRTERQFGHRDDEFDGGGVQIGWLVS